MQNIKYNQLREGFKNPPVSFRSAPFWAWSDRMCPQELKRQIRDMKGKGMGGFFMHSREGLETEYMGPEWMECIRESVKEASDMGMGAWLYDEDRWPSGAAGGLVPAKGGDAFRAKALTLEISQGVYENDGCILAVFSANISGEKLLNCTRLKDNDSAKTGNGEVMLVFRREVSGPGEWFNDDAPADNLNPDSVKAFIDITYEAYRREVGGEFGRAVPGIFTDEPNIAESRASYTPGRKWIPWTDGFTSYFLENRGYELLDVIPYIFFNGEKSQKARHDYWRTVSDRFCEAYTRQLGEWCEKNNLAFTGHFLLENSMGRAARVSGSIMPHYRYQHVPGIDMLCEQTEEYLTVKQCTSAANQYGRQRVLSETYGCTGWDFDFEGQKWIGDWQYVMGVNLRCQHLALYSLRGCRKRDYPPSFNYNNSWWKYNNLLEDYFARTGYVMSQGDVVRDVLVLHPSSTVWTMMKADIMTGVDVYVPEEEKVKSYSDEFNHFVKTLLAGHYDIDLGDETIMAERARIQDNNFVIGDARYKVVVVPQIKTLLRSTFALLEEFIEQGGRVVAVPPFPRMIEGEITADAAELFKKPGVLNAGNAQNTTAVLEALLPRRVSIKDMYGNEAASFLYMLRELDEYRTLFIVNNDREKSYRVSVQYKGQGEVEEWDLLTGRISHPHTEEVDGDTRFKTGFGPAGSRLYIIKNRETPGSSEKKQFAACNNNCREKRVVRALGPACSFARTMPNALTLDTCRWRFNEEMWSEETDVWNAQREIRKRLGMRPIHLSRIPQRYKWINEPHENDGKTVSLRFTFNVSVVPDSDVWLVLEDPEKYDIVLNGKKVESSACGWFMDRALEKIALRGVQYGLNEIVLSCRYLNSMEMEDCYLVGDFGVDTLRNITAEPERLHFGDWCMQGYFHYCGNIIYHFNTELESDFGDDRILLVPGKYSAVNMEIRVNEKTAGYIPWRAAAETDITDFLKPGNNRIDIEVAGSPRNLFGPFHKSVTTDRSVECASFRAEGSLYTRDYVLKPYGLFDQINLYRLT